MGELEDFYFPPAEVSAPAPAEDASQEEFEEWADDYEQAFEQEQFEPEQPDDEINPLEYPDAPLDPVEQQLGDEMRREAWGRAFADDLAGYVRETAAGKEFGIRDEQAVGRVTGEILAAREGLFRSWVGNGASVAQAIAALEHLNFEAAIEVGLTQESYRARTANESVGQWRQGREADARKAAMEGRQPAPDIMAHPSVQKLGRRLAASAERQQSWSEGALDAYYRSKGMR